MADAAVGFLLENIKQLLLYNAELIGDSKDQIEGLHKDLILFKAFLRDSTEKRSSSKTLQALVDNIRNVVDKAEDAIDTFVVEKARFKVKNFVKKASTAISHYDRIRQVAKNIESVRKEVKDIYEQQQFGFQALQLEEVPDKGSSSANKSPLQEDDVVGFDEEAKTVINYLTAENVPDLDIITIIGMPGLGKTTLARKIYNDPGIEYEFFTRAWIYVSQKYSRREVFLSILNTISQTTDNTNNTDETIEKDLRNCLEKGKYLIVMDDVWTTDAWDDLKAVFPNNKKGSRILITSRHFEVARHANKTRDPHKLKFLTTNESWELLEMKVFGKGKCPEVALQSVGVHIATECAGLPLAIVVIAGILMNDRESNVWWNHVAENVNSFVITEKFVDVIALSYYHLPYHLKSCFLYLGVFPEDYEIPVWKLIHLWIAEGFIEQNGEQSLEDIAEACMRDLVNRNLLMAATRRFDGQIKTCRVHDMLYDFCKKEAEKLNFYREIKRSNQQTLDHYRRVCIHSSVSEYISLKPSGEHVRSFLCFAPEEFTLQLEHISVIPRAFKLLRVLDARCITFDRFPRELLHLALLRYFAISCNVSTLSRDISKLWNMQTLILLTNKHTLELNEEMWKMYELRHVYTNASAVLPRPPSNTIKGRENVQSLSMISPESCTEHVFARTPNIKKLGVRGNLVILFDDLFDNVAKRQYLTDLKLVNDVLSRSSSEGKILRLPPAYKFPPKLKKLTLSNTSLEWVHMQILGNVETLEVLKLKDNAFKGKFWEPKDRGFLSLKLLHIGRTDLVTWKASKQHFPNLKHLVLRHCENLVEVPSGLADIISFQLLELYRTNPKASPSARAIQKVKKEKEGSETKIGGAFKLTIYPPDTLSQA